jgi:type II secretory pathway predicted ATPase ExeA
VQPPASLKALGDPIYEVFYGLTEQPFAITTDPRFFYLSASHQRAFTELLNGLRRRESLLMVTGDTGTGKTTLCRAVLHALGDRTFSAIILNPYMTGAEVLRIVLRDFGLVSHEELRRGGLAAADVAQLLDTLEGFLRALVPLGSHAVLVLDEAQSLTPAVLDQIRMLTGLEYQGHKLLQVVLCGQPGLLQTIKADGLLALNERITRRVELTALPPEDIPGYIQHRLGVAGGANSVRFDAAAMQTVSDLSRGLPRRINVLCDRALQEGRVEGVNVITADLVKRAARALAGVHEPMSVVAEPARPLSPVPAVASSYTTPPPPSVIAAQPVTVHKPAPVPVAAPAPKPEPKPEPATGPNAPTPVAPVAQEPTRIIPAPTPVVTPLAHPGPAAGVAKAPEAPLPSIADAPTPPRLPRPGLVQVQPAGVAPPAEPELPLPAAAPAAVAPAAKVAETSGTIIGGAAKNDSPAPAEKTAPAWSTPEVARSSEFLPEHTPVAERELSFGLEKPRAGHLVRNLTLAAAVLLIVAGIGYASWSWDVRDEASLVTTVPQGPVMELGIPELPPVPTAEEIEQVFQVQIVRRPAPPVDEPELVETPPEAAIPMAPDVTPTFPSP